MSDYFEDFFDFNSDGKVDPLEMGVGMDIIDDIYNQATGKDDSDIFEDDSGDGDDDYYDDPVDDSDTYMSGKSSVNNADTVGSQKPVSVSNTPPPQCSTDSYGYDDERYNNENEKAQADDSEPAVWTADYYKMRRNAELSSLAQAVLMVLLILIFPVLLIALGIYIFHSSCKDENSIGLFISAVFVLGGFAITIYFLYISAKFFIDSIKNIHQMKKTLYLRGLPQEVKHFKKMCIVKRTAAILTTVMIIAAIAVPLGFQHYNTIQEYSTAEALAFNDQYSNALQKLENIENKNFKDTQALIAYCTSNIEYGRGNYKDAYYDMYNVRFKYQSEANLAKIRQYRDKINAINDLYRDNYTYKHTTAVTTAPATKQSNTFKSYTKSKKRYTEADPYNANDYANEEDFYYDHYDDFFDYYDAESYYNDHKD